MADNKAQAGINRQLVDWIVIHLNQGYSPEYIRHYLLNRGYTINDIDEAINAAQGIVKKPPKKVHAFIFSVIAGIFVILHSIASIFGIDVPLSSYMAFFDNVLSNELLMMIKNSLGFYAFVFGFLVGLLFLLDSLLLMEQTKSRLGSFFAFILCVLSLITIDGFHIGIIAGIVAVIIGIVRL